MLTAIFSSMLRKKGDRTNMHKTPNIKYKTCSAGINKYTPIKPESPTVQVPTVEESAVCNRADPAFNTVTL